MHPQPAPQPVSLLKTYTAARLDAPPTGASQPAPNTTTSGTTCEDELRR